MKVSFEYASNAQRHLKESLGIPSDASPVKVEEVVRALICGQHGDPLSHPVMDDPGDDQDHVGQRCGDGRQTMVCPIAYRLARDAGIDPAGFLLLERLGVYANIRTPQWSGDLRFVTHGNANMVPSMEVEGPLDDGITWEGGYPGPHGKMLASALKIDSEKTKLPDTIWDTLVGKPVSVLIEHPLIPGDLIIRQAELEDEDDPTHYDIRFETNPPLVTLAEAAAAYQRLKA